MGHSVLSVLVIMTTKFDLDGITNVILNYYRAMDKVDMQIDFVVPNDIRQDLYAELSVYRSQIYKRSERNKKPWAYIHQLTQLISQNSYDIVHAHGNSCTLALEMYAAKKGGAKVRIPHSHNTTCEHKILHKLLRQPFDAYYTQAFACGQKAGEWLYKDKDFEIITNGIDIERYQYDKAIREEYRAKYKLNESVVIGHIGNFNHQKNHAYLIDVFAELFKLDKRYRLMLIGDGELRPHIENKINQLGLADLVIITGKTLDVPQLMQAMDSLVMPSRYEGVPLTLVEAQSACLPCFVSDVVSKEAAVTDLVQFIALDKSPREWAEQINTRLSINREAIKSSIHNKIVDAGHSITDNAKKMKALYQVYVEKRKN